MNRKQANIVCFYPRDSIRRHFLEEIFLVAVKISPRGDDKENITNTKR